ncbi:1-deoxy-D-xylulose-5-phosphate reductoisomerase (ISS) [Dorcoceras hygrometricum]|uniref:1-deoxy-D-xylulose-5-phosphate reductoisomerase (ISS) n=1 Tax=Dorcoceras hygrometricum TaxID=472368 RepID=A0A2Z7A071_9LAMI|nr:1-deoxy-D-xylulose-5-phosphate reductoisomerase (ISS) [Dorcoceras hygrometricum]
MQQQGGIKSCCNRNSSCRTAQPTRRRFPVASASRKMGSESAIKQKLEKINSVDKLKNGAETVNSRCVEE